LRDYDFLTCHAKRRLRNNNYLGGERMFLSRRVSRYIAIATTLFVATVSVNLAISKNKSEIEKKVLLITIDGLKPNFYLDEKYNAPTLKKIRDSGAYAEGVEVVFPSLTYPSHVTLITGAYPAQHGILSNTLFSWESGPSPAWYWEADKIKVPTLFEYVQKAGGETAAVRWPVTLFETHVDYLVPEIFDMKGFYEGDSFDLTIRYTKPEFAKEILNYTTLKRYDNEVEMDNWVAEATAYILKKKKPDFMAIHLANLDHVEHGYGPSSEEAAKAVEEVDKQIKIVMDAVDKDMCDHHRRPWLF
jgi:predicted AlkP superfamily pyrophosphatase or phosphodiesterase